MRCIPIYFLLITCTALSGCRVVLPSCSTSQLWRTYAEQQAAASYAEQFPSCTPHASRCGTCQVGGTGSPESDFRQGFQIGFVQQAATKLCIEPGPPPLCGWGWVQNGRPISMTSNYDRGYEAGVASASNAVLGGIR